MNARAVLTNALDGIGVAAADRSIADFTFNGGVISAAAARLTDPGYDVVLAHEGMLHTELLAEGWTSMVHRPGKIVFIVEAS
jgi:hypothetical protein